MSDPSHHPRYPGAVLYYQSNQPARICNPQHFYFWLNLAGYLGYHLHVLTLLHGAGNHGHGHLLSTHTTRPGRDAYHLRRIGDMFHSLGIPVCPPVMGVNPTGPTCQRPTRPDGFCVGRSDPWAHKTLPLFHRLPLILVLWGLQRTTGSLLI